MMSEELEYKVQLKRMRNQEDSLLRKIWSSVAPCCLILKFQTVSKYRRVSNKDTLKTSGINKKKHRLYSSVPPTEIQAVFMTLNPAK